MDESTLLTLAAAEHEAAAWKRSNDEWLRQATWLARRVAQLEQRLTALEAAARAVVGEARPDPATDPICWLDADAEAVRALQALLGDAPSG